VKNCIFIPLFPNLSSPPTMEQLCKEILRIPWSPCLWKFLQARKQMQLVGRGDKSSITNCHTKIPAIFQGVFGIVVRGFAICRLIPFGKHCLCCRNFAVFVK
jgi:hypothetical protein